MSSSFFGQISIYFISAADNLIFIRRMAALVPEGKMPQNGWADFIIAMAGLELEGKGTTGSGTITFSMFQQIQ